MSYDLIFWRGRPDGSAERVWSALYNRQPVNFVMPLVFADVRAAFEAELKGDLRVDEKTGEIQGRGWETTLHDGDRYIHVVCSWQLAQDRSAIVQLKRAGQRAGCSMFDPQSSAYVQAPAFPKSAPEPAPTAVAAAAAAAPEFAIGGRVSHPTFGEGDISAVLDDKLRIKFATGERVLLSRFVKRI